MEQSTERGWSRTDFTDLTFDQRREVAEQITTERKARNITQEDLARLADVPVRTISNLETGKTPQAGTLRKLADALGSNPPGKPDDATAMQLLIDVSAPLYLKLSERAQAKVRRNIALLLVDAFEEDRANAENQSSPGHP